MHTHVRVNMHQALLVEFTTSEMGNSEDGLIEVSLTLQTPIATDLDVRIRTMNLTQVFELTDGEVARPLIDLPNDFPNPGVFDKKIPYIASSECHKQLVGMA